MDPKNPSQEGKTDAQYTMAREQVALLMQTILNEYPSGIAVQAIFDFCLDFPNMTLMMTQAAEHEPTKAYVIGELEATLERVRQQEPLSEEEFADVLKLGQLMQQDDSSVH